MADDPAEVTLDNARQREISDRIDLAVTAEIRRLKISGMSDVFSVAASLYRISCSIMKACGIDEGQYVRIIDSVRVAKNHEGPKN